MHNEFMLPKFLKFVILFGFSFAWQPLGAESVPVWKMEDGKEHEAEFIRLVLKFDDKQKERLDVELKKDGKSGAIPFARLHKESQGQALRMAGQKADVEALGVDQQAVPDDLKKEMIRINAGEFDMGDSHDNLIDAIKHSVTLGKFQIGKYEVTKELWDEVRDWGLNNGYKKIDPGISKDKGHPVCGVSWWDAVLWCNAYSEKEKLQPVYYANGNIMRGIDLSIVPVPDWSANGYRLPTEAEWERAARSHKKSARFVWGDKISHDDANYQNINLDQIPYSDRNSRGYHPMYAKNEMPHTSPVGSFKNRKNEPQDLAGNVTEWCWDWYDEKYYSVSEAKDPKGPPSGLGRVVRGGSWLHDAGFLRVAHRTYFSPQQVLNNVGFRVVQSMKD